MGQLRRAGACGTQRGWALAWGGDGAARVFRAGCAGAGGGPPTPGRGRAALSGVRDAAAWRGMWKAQAARPARPRPPHPLAPPRARDRCRCMGRLPAGRRRLTVGGSATVAYRAYRGLPWLTVVYTVSRPATVSRAAPRPEPPSRPANLSPHTSRLRTRWRAGGSRPQAAGIRHKGGASPPAYSAHARGAADGAAGGLARAFSAASGPPAPGRSQRT